MYSKVVSKLILIIGLFITLVNGQYDLGEIRRGEHRGKLTPGEIATITVIVIAVCMAFSVTVFFCYYVNKQNQRREARYIYQG